MIPGNSYPTDTTPYPHRPRPLTQVDRDRMAYAWLVAAERRFPSHIISPTAQKEPSHAS